MSTAMMSQTLSAHRTVPGAWRVSSRQHMSPVWRPAVHHTSMRPDTRRQALQTTAVESTATKEQRWENQVIKGSVKNVTCEQAAEMMKEGWVLLDVRPESEVKKVSIDGAVVVHMFLPDPAMDPGALLKKLSAYGFGGWWMGGTHMIPNPTFLQEIEAKVPKDANVIVGCQKGLRSLAACEQLSEVGYTNLAWINGGFDTGKAGVFPTTGAVDIRYGGIGGLAETIGWTVAQQENEGSMGFLGGTSGPVKVALAVLAADLLWVAYDKVVEFVGTHNL